MIYNIILIAALVVVAVILIFVAVKSTLRFAPDGYASIVTGFGDQTIHIREAFIKLPVVHKVTELVISKFSLDIRTDERNKVKTRDMFDTQLDANANVYLALNLPKETFERMMMASANDSAYDIVRDENDNIISRTYVPERDTTRLTDEDFDRLNDIIIDTYAGKGTDEVAKYAIDILNATLREAVGSLDLLTIQSDKDAFGSRILELAIRDLLRIGFVIDNFNIQDFKDTEGTLDGMGENSKEIIMEASVIERNESLFRQETNTSTTLNRTDEQERINNMEIAKRATKFDIDTQALEQGKVATLAAQRAESSEKSAQSAIRIAKATSEAEVAQNEAKANILKSQAIVREQELTIERSVEVSATANAEKHRQQIENETRLKEAQSQREIASVGVEIAKLKAEAILAEDEAIAKGIELKAIAQGKMSDIEIKSQVITMLPELVRAQASLYDGIDGVTIIGGSDSVSNYGSEALDLASTNTTLKRILGFGLDELVGTNVSANINAKAMAQELKGVDDPIE